MTAGEAVLRTVLSTVDQYLFQGLISQLGAFVNQHAVTFRNAKITA